VVARAHGDREGGAPLVVFALLLVGVVTLDAVGRGVVAVVRRLILDGGLRRPERSYGVRPVNRAGVSRPAVCGVGCRRGSASAVVDVCVATHMRGLVPHDRVCEMRSGADLSRRAWPLGAARGVLSGRSSRRCAGALSSPSRWWRRLLDRRERPAVSGELARDGDHDDRAGLASGLERVPASVEPAGAAVGLGSQR
jgi:hypothetical protein